MKLHHKYISLVILFMGLLLAGSQVRAAIKTAGTTGPWSSTTTWGGALPLATDDVQIAQGVTLTVDGNYTCNSISFAGTPNSGTGTGTLSVSSGFVLTVTTSVSGPSGVLATKVNAAYVITGAGSVSCASLTVNNSATPGGSSNTTITITSTITTLTISGDLTLNATFKSAGSKSNNPVFDLQSGMVTVGGSVGSVNADASNVSTLTTVNGAQSGTLVLTGGTPFNLSGTGTSTMALNGTSATVNYQGTSSQSALGTTYTNLKINNAAGVTLGGIATVTTLTIGDVTANSIFNDGGFQVTSTGTLNLTSGTLNLGSGATATTYPAFAANTIGAATTVNYSSSSAQTVAAVNYGNLSNTGNGNRTLASSGTIGIAGTFTSGSGSYTVTGSTVSFNGAGAQTIPAFAYNNLQTATGGTKTLGGTVTVNTVLTVGGSTTLDLSSQTLNLAGSGTPLVVTGALTPSTSTVNYTNAGATTIAAANYYNLNGTGGNRTLSNSGTIGIANTFTPGAGAYTVTGSTVSFNGAGAQTIPALTYNNLQTATGGTKTLGGTVTVNTVLTVGGSTTLDLSSQTLNLVGSGTPLVVTGTLTPSTSTVNYTNAGATTIAAANYYNLNGTGGARTLDNSATIGIANTFTPGAGAYTVTGSTVDFNGTGAQSIPAFNFNNLTISGARTTNSVTLVNGGTIGIAGTFSPTATFSTGGYIVTGNTVSFNGAGAQSIPAFAYNNLQTATGGTKTLGGTVTVNTVLTVGGSTTLDLSSQTLNLAGSGTPLVVTGALTPSTSTVNYTNAGATTIAAANYYNLNGTGGNRTLSNSGTIGIANTFTPGAGAYTVTGSTVSFNGAGAQSIPAFTYDNLQTATGGTKTLGGAVSVNTVLTVGGSTTLDLSSQTLNLVGSGTPLAVTGTLTPSTSTVNYTNAGATTIAAANYYNLNGTGGNRTLDNSATIGIGNTFTPGAGAFTVTGSTVSFNGAGAQSIPAFTYNNLQTATGGTKTFGGTVTVNAILTVGGSTTLDLSSQTLNLAGSGTPLVVTGSLTPSTSTVNYTNAGATTIAAANYCNLNGTGGNRTLSSSGTIGIGNTFTPGAGAYTVTGSMVSFNSAGAQTIPAFNFNNLTSSSTGARTLASGGTIGVAGTFTAGTNAYTITGSTIDFNGSAQTIPAFNGVTGYNNLTLSNSGPKTTLGGTTTTVVSGTLSLGAGVTYETAASATATLTLNGAANMVSGTLGSVVNPFATINVGNGTTISATGSLNAGTVAIGASTTVTNNGTASISGNLTDGGSSVWTNAANSTLNVGGLLLTSGTLNATAAGNAVNYNGTGSQAVKTANYANLTISGSRGANTVTLPAGSVGVSETFSPTATFSSGSYDVTANTINYNGSGAQSIAAFNYYHLTINNNRSGNNVTLASGTIGIAGTFTDNTSGGAVFITSGNQINYNGTGAQTITIFNYNDLTISGTRSGNITLANSSTIGVSGVFNPTATFISGGYVNTGSTFNFNGSGPQTIAAFNYNNLTSSSTGARTLASSGTIGIAGTFLPDGSAYTITSSTVDFNGTGAQTIPVFSFNNLTISGSRTSNSVTLDNVGSINVAGVFNNSATFSSGGIVATGSTIVFNGTAAQSISGSQATPFNNVTINNASGLTNSTTGTSVAGTLTLANGTFTLTGGLTMGGGAAIVRSSGILSGAPTFGATVDVSYTNGGSIGTGSELPTSTTVLRNLTINGAGITLTANVQVNNVLTFTLGNITTGANTLTIGPSGSVSRASGYVIGKLAKPVSVTSSTPTFEIGDASNYTPVSATFTSVTVSGTLTASTTPGDHPDIVNSDVDQSHSVNRYWTLSNSGTTFTTCDVIFNFVASDVDPGSNTANFIAGEYSGGTWSMPTVGTKNATNTQVTGLTPAALSGDYQLGLSAGGIYTSIVSGNWNVVGTWDQPGVPGNKAIVIIAAGTTVTIDANTANIRSLEIKAAGTLQGGGSYTLSFGAHSGTDFLNNGVFNANSVTTKLVKNSQWDGAGQFNLNILDLNLNTLTLSAGMATVHLSGSGNSIVNPGSLAAGSNSTIDFNGTGAQTISPFNYNNLSISGARTTNSITLVNGGTIGISGTFTTSSVTFTTGGFVTSGNVINCNGTGAQAISAFNYNDLYISGGRSGATVTLTNAGTIGIAGVFVPQATSVSYALTGSTVDYNSASDQGIAGGAAFPAYNNLTISGSGSKLLSADVSVNGNLMVRTGNTLADAGYQITGNGTGTMTVETGATLALGSALTATQFPTSFTSGNIALNTASTVNYKSGQAQTISGVPTYGNILLTGAGAKSLGGSSVSVAGNWTNNSGGTVDATGSTVVFNGAAQVINGSAKTTFNNLTIGGTAGKTADVNVDVSGGLAVNQPLAMSGSNVLTMLDGASQPTFTSLEEIAGTMTWQAYNAASYKFNNDQTVITFTGADVSRTFTVIPAPNTYPAFGAVLAGHTVKRVYTVNHSGWSTGTATLKLAYLQGEASTLGVAESRLKAFQADIVLGNSLNGVPTRSPSSPTVFGTVSHSGLTSANLTSGQIGMDDRFGLFKSVLSQAWNVATTWDQNAVPSTWDYVIVDNNHPVTIPDAFTADALSVTINATATGLTVGAGVSGVLNIGTGGLTNNGSGTGLTVAPNGNVTITGGVLTTAGSITNNGTVTVQ